MQGISRQNKEDGSDYYREDENDGALANFQIEETTVTVSGAAAPEDPGYYYGCRDRSRHPEINRPTSDGLDTGIVRKDEREDLSHHKYAEDTFEGDIREVNPKVSGAARKENGQNAFRQREKDEKTEEGGKSPRQPKINQPPDGEGRGG